MVYSGLLGEVSAMALDRSTLEHKIASGESLVEVDLVRARLKGIKLAGQNLHKARLAGADLEGADLTGANLSGADLSGARLGGADLSGADLSGVDLRRARMRGTRLVGVNLSGARLARVDLSEVTLGNADLGKADLTEVVFSNLELTDLKFGEAVLVRAILDGVKLTRVDFTGADLDEAYLERAQLEDVQLVSTRMGRANLVRARLTRVTLHHTLLVEADLAEVVFKESTLTEVDLTSAIFDQADLAGAIFERCKVEGADLQGVTGLTQEQLTTFKAQGAIVGVLALGKLLSSLASHHVVRWMGGVLAVVALAGFLFYYSRASQQPIEAVLARAAELRRERNFVEALGLYDELLGQSQGKPDQEIQILYLKAETLLELDRPAEAASIYEALSGRTGSDKDEAISAKLKLGDLLVFEADYDRAVTLYQQIAADGEATPTDVARALIGLAGTYQKMGFDDKALEVAQGALTRYPDNPAIALTVNRYLARVLMEKQEFAEAEAVLARLDDFVRDDSDKAELLMSRARLYTEMGDEARALSSFEELVRLFPSNPEVTPEVRLELAQLLMERGDYEHAERIFRDLGEQGPTATVRQQATIHLARLLLTLGQNLKARDALQQVLEGEPLAAEDRGTAQMVMVDVLVKVGQTDVALLLLKELVAAPERGQAGPALLRQAEVYREKGQVAEARATYQDMLTRFAGREEFVTAASQGLAQLSGDQGQWSDAVTRYQALLTGGGTPDERSGLYQALGQAQIEARDLAGAEATFRAMQAELTDEESRARAAFGLAQLAVARGTPRDAVPLLRGVADSVEDVTLKAIALETLARTWLDMGQEQEATLTYSEIVDRVPRGHDAAFGARMGLANLYAQKRNIEQAKKLYLAAIEDTARADKKVQGYLALAQLDMETGNLEGASEIYDRLLTQFGAVGTVSFQSRMGMADLARARGELEKAATLFKEVAQESEDPELASQALGKQAQVLESLGRPQEALALQQQILRRFGSDPETAFQARFAAAGSLRQDGDLAGALAAYDKLLKETVDPGLQLQLLDAMAQTQAELGQLEEAATSYQNLARQATGQADLLHNALMGLAGIRRAQGRPGEAVDLYRQVATQTLDRAMQAWALESIAQVAAEKGDNEAAIAAYEDILKRFGDDPATVAGARLGLGQLRRRLGDPTAARQQFELVIASAQDPSQKAWASLYSAQTLAEQDALSDALALYLEIPRNFPAEQEVVINARLGLADLYRVKGKNDDALKIYDEVAQGPGFSEYRVTALQGKAALAQDKGDPALARATYEEILRRFGSMPEAVFNARLGLARLKIREGATSAKAAIPQLEEMVASAQDPTLRAWARQTLAQAQVAAGDKAGARTTYQALIRDNGEQPDLAAEARAFVDGR